MIEFIYHFGPPITVAILTIYVGRKIKKGDELRSQAREADDRHRKNISIAIGAVLKQNSWMVRKFVELGTMHNTRHPKTRIDMDDYPNGFDMKKGD